MGIEIFAVAGTLVKIGTMLGVGLGLTTSLEFFHNYKYTAKKGGNRDDNFETESVRKRFESQR